MKRELDFHPLADCFPLITGDEFDKLCSSVKESGVRVPLTLYEGAILDGRNRYRAAQHVNGHAALPTTEFTGTFEDAKKLVVDVNLARRHMTKSQRAVAAEKLANCTVGNPGFPNSANLHDSEKTSLEQAAKMMGVSRRTVASVREYEKLKTAGKLKPTEITAVEAGTPHSAIVKKAKDRGDRAAQRKTQTLTPHQKMRDDAQRRKFLAAVGALRTASEGICTMTPELTDADRREVLMVCKIVQAAIKHMKGQ